MFEFKETSEKTNYLVGREWGDYTKAWKNYHNTKGVNQKRADVYMDKIHSLQIKLGITL